MVLCLRIKNRPDGKKYEGNWAKGKQHGRGVYTNRKGEIVEGEWNQGRRLDGFGDVTESLTSINT